MENGNKKQPLLSPIEKDEDDQLTQDNQPHYPRISSRITIDSDDIPLITGLRVFSGEFYKELKKLWYIAGPAIFTSVAQYSLGAITQVFSGHVSTIALAAVSVENSVIAGFSFGAMMGMGSALETLCGQAYGAGQIDMLGIYMQRSWVILNASSLILMFLYIFAYQILSQTAALSKAAGTFAIWMIPQLFAYAMNFPMQKFLQSQSKIMVMAVIAAVVLILHTFFSWLLMLKLGWGLTGAAVVLNVSWWIIDISQFLYIVSGTCGRAWTGFSLKAFQNLWGFVRLSLSSAVMLCLEVWYFMALVLFAGYLKNAEVSVDALSIWNKTMNILGWTVMIAMGMNAAISVRVSNELGAGHPRTAKFSLMVAVLSSFIIGLVLSLVLIISRDHYPDLFSSDSEVTALVKELTPLLALCITINNIQPVLSGVAVGAGWQGVVAYVNIGCYYLFGIPLGLVLGFKGIWSGMLTGTVLQTLILFGMIYKTNWNKEASIAEDRIRKWGGGDTDTNDIGVEK
ncbi:hypothetical protein EZV62_017539 [Acer yangbiense]|uniref:Protein DETOXIFICATION n=1 Tax=Acer yangbiense TaxID=1000413 RepID=A0A5C7HJ51_9ROSI|nr:hypothetical protein EZV62_017539 [Acer yangbiense]